MDIAQTLQQAVNLHVSGNLEEAEQGYRRVLSANPDHPDAIHFMGVLAYNRGLLDAAKTYIKRAIELIPDNAGCYTNMGNVLQQEGNYPEAVAYYRKSLDLNRNNKLAQSNLGVAYTKLEQFGPAVDAFNAAITLDPQYTEAYCNLCETYKYLGDYDQAEACCENALSVSPDHVQAHWNLSLLKLLKGDFENGFKAYEWRWQRDSTPKRAITAGERWTGQPLEGKSIFVYEEQGLGDTIQFMRYLPLLRELGGRVIFEVLPPLIRLVSSYKDLDRLWVAQRNVDTRETDRFDYHIPLLSIPGILNTTLDTIPCVSPYLSADGHLSKIWKKRLGKPDKFKVGVVWAGHPDHKNDANRSVLLSHFKPMADMEDIALFSVQKDKYEKWTDTDPAAVFDKDLGEEICDFSDTAAIIDNLDLVISVDTSVVHLAGALGKTTWTLLPFSPDWRWMLDRNDSPWYPSMTLFRQPAHGDWDSVFDKINASLFGMLEKKR